MDPPEEVVPHPETSNEAPVGIASSESTNSAGAALSKKEEHFMTNKGYKVCTYKKPYMFEVGSFAIISKQASLLRS